VHRRRQFFVEQRQSTSKDRKLDVKTVDESTRRRRVRSSDDDDDKKDGDVSSSSPPLWRNKNDVDGGKKKRKVKSDVDGEPENEESAETEKHKNEFLAAMERMEEAGLVTERGIGAGMVK